MERHYLIRISVFAVILLITDEASDHECGIYCQKYQRFCLLKYSSCVWGEKNFQIEIILQQIQWLYMESIIYR